MVDGFMLLVGHMLGDYVLQNDWQAKNKVNPPPGPRPGSFHPVGGGWAFEFVESTERGPAWHAARHAWWLGHRACTVHCLLYTLAVWACTFWWMPWWGLLACFLLHWPVDRFRLARWWMDHVSGQSGFAARTDWGVVVVDNTCHLLVLGVIGKLATG